MLNVNFQGFPLCFFVIFALTNQIISMFKFHTKAFLCFVLSMMSVCVTAQNEFYIKGDNTFSSTNPEVFINGTDSVNPTLYVNGEIVNYQGQFVNQTGEIELTGDFTNTANGSSAFYESTGIERFSGNDVSAISGDLSDTTANLNQFFNLKVDKSAATNYVELHTNVNVNKNGTLEFEGNGIVTTDASNHSGNGADYDYVLFVRNDTVSAISGHSVGNGATNKYIEGKLKRQIKVGEYYFPIGVDVNSIDGMESFNLTAHANFNSAVEAFVLDEGSITLPSAITTYADLGTHPAGNTAGLDFSYDLGNCSSGDGILDRVDLTIGQSHSWVVSPDSSGTFNYDIEFFPGPILEASASFYTCGSLELQYLSKDDVPGGTGTTSGPGLPTFTANGYYATPNNTNKLTAQNSFSTFRNMGPTVTSTTLPVELVTLTAYGVDNDYINIDWITATEVNNEGFEIQRSIDGVNFTKIAFVDGAGNSTDILNYRWEDFEVQKNVVYYYRLKQYDFNGEFEFSDIVSTSLKAADDFNVNVYPNPANTTDELIVEISSPSISLANVRVFDVVGRLLIAETIELMEGVNKYTLSNHNFAAGQYFIVANMAEEQLTKNIIITSK